MMPAVYGCSAQQSSSGSPSIAISSIVFQTFSYGLTVESGTTAISPSDAITTTLNAGNSFTVPTDGLAQYFSNSNPVQQVLHSMQVNYTATNFTISDLPPDGSCVVGWETSNFSGSDPRRHFNTWPLQGTIEGAFLPNNATQTGLIWTTTPTLNRSDAFETTPTLLNSGAGLDVCSVKTSKGNQPNSTDRLLKLGFAAQNLGSSSSFDLQISITLGNGSVITSPAQTITVPADAVKTNLLVAPTINSYTTTTVGYGIGGGSPIETVPAPLVLTSTLDTANSFTTPNAVLSTGMAQRFSNSDPDSQVLHGFQVNLDTSMLNLAEYPETSLLVDYIFTWNPSTSNIPQSEGILWDGELGTAFPANTITNPATGETNRRSTASFELDSVSTNTLIPFASVNFPYTDPANVDYTTAWKAYSGLEIGGTSYEVSLEVRIFKTDGSFITTDAQLLTINSLDGVLDEMS